jgi:hypothetical protein
VTTAGSSVIKRSYITRETLIAGLSVVGIGAHLALRTANPAWATWPLLAVLALGGGPLVVELLRKALKRQFGSDLLAGISIVTCCCRNISPARSSS